VPTTSANTFSRSLKHFSKLFQKLVTCMKMITRIWDDKFSLRSRRDSWRSMVTVTIANFYNFFSAYFSFVHSRIFQSFGKISLTVGTMKDILDKIRKTNKTNSERRRFQNSTCPIRERLSSLTERQGLFFFLLGFFIFLFFFKKI